jgi:hypothetical protein
MIDTAFAKRLAQLEQDRFRLIGLAVGYRLEAFNAIESLAPRAAKFDRAIALVRYVREHWAVTGAIFALASFLLRKRIGMLGLAHVALKLGRNVLAR